MDQGLSEYFNERIQIDQNSLIDALRTQVLKSKSKVLLYFNDKPARTSSGYAIAFSSFRNEPRADLVEENAVYAIGLSLKFIGDLKVNKSGSLIGKSLGIAYDRIKKVLYVGRINGLNGGSENQIKLNQLVEYRQLLDKVSDIKNPFVAKDLKTFLEKFIEKTNIDPKLIDCLPKDIELCIKSLMKSLEEYQEKNEIPAIKQQLTSNILDAIQDQEEYWDSFSIFLELPCIKKIDVLKCKNIIDHIKRNDGADDIESLIVTYVKKEDTANDFVENINYNTIFYVVVFLKNHGFGYFVEISVLFGAIGKVVLLLFLSVLVIRVVFW